MNDTSYTYKKNRPRVEVSSNAKAAVLIDNYAEMIIFGFDNFH